MRCDRHDDLASSEPPRASPCPEPWDEMTGDERARRCAKCDIDVFDVTEMTTAEAETLLGTRGGSDSACASRAAPTGL